MKEQQLYVSSSPHIHDGASTARLMWMVFAALMPAAIWSVYLFGMAALTVIVSTVAFSAIFEWLAHYFLKKPATLRDGSSLLSGLILALTLPPGLDIWICGVGAFVAMVVAKAFFGGLGQNVFNPAMTARVFMLIAFPTQLTRWIVPRGTGDTLFELPVTALNAVGKVVDPGTSTVDVVTAATPLGILDRFGLDLQSAAQFFSNKDLMLGTINGSIGETSVLFLGMGGLFLMLTKVITWHIPVSCLATVAIMGGLLGFEEPSVQGSIFHLFTGAAVMGAFFIATDYVTSPINPKGKLIFGAGIGIFTMVIRLWAGYPEGVSFAVLLMNAAVPIIDRYTKPRKFGFKAIATKGGM